VITIAKTFLLFFFLFSAGDLVNVWFDFPYRQVTKPGIIFFLTLYFISSTPRTRFYNLFIVALVFAWMGDVFLLFSGANFFLIGLCSFLFMQIVYSYIFYKDKQIQKKKAIISILILGAFSIGFNSYLWPFAQEMRVPVIIYSMAITLMAFTGINREKSLLGYRYIFIGVILFVISDTILAINNFGPGFWKGGFVVMLTYILAQYYIVEGYARRLRSSV